MIGSVLTARDMQLGDTVELVSEKPTPWSSCIVRRATDEEVTLFRPYGVTADFSYTGGVICYVGIEEYKVLRDSSIPYRLLARQVLK